MRNSRDIYRMSTASFELCGATGMLISNTRTMTTHSNTSRVAEAEYELDRETVITAPHAASFFCLFFSSAYFSYVLLLDLAFAPNGDLCFTDPSYGLQRVGAPGVIEGLHERYVWK